MTFGSRLACERTCFCWMHDLIVFSALNAGELYYATIELFRVTCVIGDRVGMAVMPALARGPGDPLAPHHPHSFIRLGHILTPAPPPGPPIATTHYVYSTTVIRRVDDSDVQNHGKWRFTGMNLLLKAVLNSSDPGQYIRQGASKRTR